MYRDPLAGPGRDRRELTKFTFNLVNTAFCVAQGLCWVAYI